MSAQNIFQQEMRKIGKNCVTLQTLQHKLSILQIIQYHKMKTYTRLLPLLMIALLVIVTMASCRETVNEEVKADWVDSLMNEAYLERDYERLIFLSDQMQTSGDMSEIKANYWRGYAYSRQQKIRLAENFWKKAVMFDINSKEDLEYYAKSANRLASVLLLKGDYEETLKIAVPTIQKMDKEGYCDNEDYAYLLITIGCCQLKLGSQQDAEKAFSQALLKYQQVIGKTPNEIRNYHGAIAGVVTITDNYLMLMHYEEARKWTEHFEELLNKYKQLPTVNRKDLDKQQARLYLYRACALEGLGHHQEAAMAYNKAQLTDYAKTGDGMVEATNYLISAHRWNEAAHNFEILDLALQKYNIKYSLDIITRYLLPKFRANVGAQRRDSALAVGMLICKELNTAITEKQKDDAMELATIYNTQQKETELADQKAKISRQRFIVAFIALVLTIVFFALIIYFRHQAALRLEKAYKQLAIANERAKESSRMKTAFIQQISHEIRTPLNILSGFTQVITTPDMELDEATKADINKNILENTNRITQLINKMLELSDANSRTVIERNDTVQAVQIAAQAAEDSCISNAQHIHFEMQVSEAAESVRLTTNLQQATRAMSLLLDNAQRYTKNGTVRLILSIQDNYVSFVVEDTGIGIPPSEAEHIFDEFVQLDNYNEGTGIGLTVARSIIRRLGGDIVLDTTYDKGARFVTTLPLSQA